MSLEDTKEKLEWCKRVFQYRIRKIYGIENRNDMARIHSDKVNKTAKWNLQHDIVNLFKYNNNLDIHYSPSLHVCMDNREGRAKFKRFRVLLDSGCNFTILMGKLAEKLSPEKKMIWCSGTHRLVILLPILRLEWLSPYPHLFQKMSWRENVMWIIPIRVGMIWS